MGHQSSANTAAEKRQDGAMRDMLGMRPKKEIGQPFKLGHYRHAIGFDLGPKQYNLEAF